jgi:phospholipase C
MSQTDRNRDTNRRGFLLSTAAEALALLGGAPLQANARQQSAAKLSDIDHIIILMKENRSFDHYFGMLRGVRGFDDPHAMRLRNGRPVFEQPDLFNLDGHLLPFRLDTVRTSAQRLTDLAHAWGTQHASWHDGKMDNWVMAHRVSRRFLAAPLTMGYHTREDLPFYYALADAFTICDGYHCSVLGPTHPNRFHLWTGTIDPNGEHGGPALTNDQGARYSWETYPERLERAGISWRIYHDIDDYDCNVVKYFAQFQDAPATSPLRENALRNRPFVQLLADLRSGNIPQIVWIVPPSWATEHPPYMPAAGADYTRQVLEALWSNRALWSRSAFILNYDENDGQFDHVAPPVPEPRTPGEFVGNEPVGLGFRVPCLVISPFSGGGFVCGEVFDHTSTLRLIETRFGVEVANLSSWRRRVCGDLTSAFGFGEPAQFTPPELPETEQALRAAIDNLPNRPAPARPSVQAMPRQEAGTRPRRG